VTAFQCKICGPKPDDIIEELNAFLLNEMLSMNFEFLNGSEIKE